MNSNIHLCSVLKVQYERIVGVINGEGPPVPIPNTEVKLTRADNTWLEAAREDRSMPTLRPQSYDCGLFHIFFVL